MNIILSSLITIPELINGKVCVINTDGSYSLYNPSKYTNIAEKFNPLDYSILISPKYNKCIINSTKQEKEFYLVNEAYKKYFPVELYRKGDKIHIKSRRGVYSIVAIDSDYLIITCNKWKFTGKPTLRIHKSDFDCLAGGFHNYNE